MLLNLVTKGFFLFSNFLIFCWFVLFWYTRGGTVMQLSALSHDCEKAGAFQCGLHMLVSAWVSSGCSLWLPKTCSLTGVKLPVRCPMSAVISSSPPAKDNNDGWMDGPLESVLFSFGLHVAVLYPLFLGPPSQSFANCLPLHTGKRRTCRANGRASRPPLHMYTSWWRCWESVWRGGWWGRGTAPGILPPWVLSGEFGRRSDTCCLPLVAVSGSPLQFESRGRKLVLNSLMATPCLWVLCSPSRATFP